MNRLKVSKLKVSKNRLEISFQCKGQIRKFFIANRFIAEYDTPIEDVPDSILIIPFLATVFPIACANQAEVFVETVDEVFLSSLNVIRKRLQEFYPQIRFTGNVRAKNIVSTSVQARTRRMILFSGGVDSLTTFIRHKDEKSILVSMQEEDFLTDSERKSQSNVRFNISMHISQNFLDNFSNMVKSEHRIVRSNWIFLPDNFWLKVYRTKLSGENWYRRVMHGLAFAGLCAPLAYIENVDKLYIASSFTAEAQMPWGSHPEIDNNIRWAGTKVEHDGYELSRQDKMFLIADYLKDKPGLQICSCAGDISSVDLGKNCNVCEKCGRTIVGFEIAGIDPNKHGFSVNAKTFSQIKENIENGTWAFKDDEVYMWKDIQKHAGNSKEVVHDEARELIDWIQTVNIERLRVESGRLRRIDAVFEILPYPIFKLAEKLYIKLNEKFN